MEKINIAELIKDCPAGTKFYSPIFGDVYLKKIRPHLAIVVTTDKEQGNIKEEFLYDGRYGMNGECMLFPSKDKTTWEGFVPPFKDGDIVTHNYEIGLVSMILNKFVNFEEIHYHCALYDNAQGFITDNYIKENPKYIRLATEEEKQKLFDAIKANGYKWNTETKTLEKLGNPKFKDGDIIITHAMFNNLSKYLNLGRYYTWISIFHKMCKNEVITYVDMLENDMIDYPFWMYGGELCRTSDNMSQRLATEEEKEKLFKFLKDNGCKWNAETKTLETLIEPKFKVGDKVVRKNGIGVPVLITRIEKNYYYSDNGDLVEFFKIVDQDDYVLVPNKFDISTLVPFESRVLVRDFEDQIWRPAIFGGYIDNREQYKFTVVGGLSYECLIPYEGNEHLRCKDDDCKEFYKTWKL